MEKVALVTGSGAERVGAGVIPHLASRGFRLVIHYHKSRESADSRVRSLSQQGIEALAIGADLSKEDQVARLLEQTWDHFGRCDVLVHSAAIWDRKKLEEVKAADVLHQFEVNTLSTFLCLQKFGLAMADQASGGVLITIGDWACIRPYPDYAAYFVSKGSIPTLTRTMAIELGTRNPNVRVNCILPGPVLAPPGCSPEHKESRIQSTLVKKEGHPDFLAKAVLYLIDNEFVTGEALHVDGGRSIFANEVSSA